MTPTWYERNRRQMEAWSNAIFDRVVYEAAIAAYVEMPSGWYGPGIGRIEMIVGYDPQKLLPSPERLIREWMAAVTKAFMPLITEGEVWISARDWAKLAGHRSINFRDLYDGVPDVTRWNEADSDPLADIQRWKDEMVGPTGRRIRYHEPRIHTYEHKVAIIRNVSYGDLEARILAQMSDRRVRAVILDIDEPGGEIIGPGFSFADRPQAKAVAKKAPPAYLKHDPSKSHKRRRR